MKRPSFHSATIAIAEMIFIGIIVGILYLTYFLYVSFYQSISLTERITLLQQEVTVTEIDAKSVERVKNFIGRRDTLPSIDQKKVKNPFK